MKSFKEHLSEASRVTKNKWGYDKFQWFMIRQWGSILYMDYEGLKPGPVNMKELEKHIDDYIEIVKSGDTDEAYEFDDWVQEGMRSNGKPLLTKTAFDKIMVSAERKIPKPITVYKSGKKTHSGDRWISTTLQKDAPRYSDYGDTETFELPKGTPVIFADGIADGDEVIINTKNLPRK